VVGSEKEDVTMLTSAEWTPLDDRLNPWNQFHVESGYAQEGYWEIKAENEGLYLFDVGRWPKESGLSIADSMRKRSEVDAYELDKGRDYSIYNYHNETFPALKIASVRLTIDSVSLEEKVSSDEKLISFQTVLKKGNHKVKADLIDDSGNVITSAYYLYVSLPEE